MDTTYAVQTDKLTKTYGERIVAVDNLRLQVRHGEVYGFLGPNGAGKTTTLRMLVGLIRPTSGHAQVLGAAPGSPEGLSRIGAMIEAPAFYPFLSGYDNLKVIARYAGVPESRIAPALKEVDLSARAGDRFSAYSMGMKQRLGVAAALLKDPDLLILDEPTNGLDPAGMAEMREFIRHLGQGKHTVILSSHLMTEVEHICDRVGIIRGGSLVAEGTVSELRGQDRLRVKATPQASAYDLLVNLTGNDRVVMDNGCLHLNVSEGDAPEINRALVQAGIAVSELRMEQSSLEEVFLELTQDQGRRSETGARA